MQLDLQTLRDETRDILGVDSDDVDNTKLDMYLNISFSELQDKVKFRQKEVQAEFNTTAGTASYALSTRTTNFSWLTRVLIRGSDETEYVPLNRRDYESYSEVLSTDSSLQDTPTS